MPVNTDRIKDLLLKDLKVLSMKELFGLAMGGGSVQDRLVRLFAARGRVALGRLSLDHAARQLTEQIDAIMEANVSGGPSVEERVHVGTGLAINMALQIAGAAGFLDEYAQAEGAVARRKAELGSSALLSGDQELERLRLERRKAKEQFVLAFNSVGTLEDDVREAPPTPNMRPARRSDVRGTAAGSDRDLEKQQQQLGPAGHDPQQQSDSEFLRVGAPKAEGTPPSGDLTAIGQMSTDPSDRRQFDTDAQTPTTTSVEANLAVTGGETLGQGGGDEPEGDQSKPNADETYEDWTVEELKGRAEELGLTGLSKLRKDELITEIERAEVEQRQGDADDEGEEPEA